MNKKEYRKAVDQIQPDDSLREKVWQGLGNKSSYISKLKFSAFAFVSVLILSIVTFNTLNSGISNKKFDKVKYSKSVKKARYDKFIGYDEDKVESFENRAFDKNSIPNSAESTKNESAALKSYGLGSNGTTESNSNKELLQYQTGSIGNFEFEARTYREDKNNYSYNIQNLKNEKIGVTNILFFKGFKGNELFKDEPFHPNKKDLEAYPNGYEVYSVRGYDPAYRLMIYGEVKGEQWGSIYNCFTGKYFASGKELFGNLYLKGNIKIARWESIDSWRRKLGVYKTVKQSIIFDNFIDGLYTSKRTDYYDLSGQKIVDDVDKCKILSLMMKNNIVEQIWLYPDTKMVEYKEAGIFFKVEDNLFDSFFKTLK